MRGGGRLEKRIRNLKVIKQFRKLIRFRVILLIQYAKMSFTRGHATVNADRTHLYAKFAHHPQSHVIMTFSQTY